MVHAPLARGVLQHACDAIATVYLLGEVFGALFFGRLSDALGRKNLFVVTLGSTWPATR
jgi:MFS family permease